jgi:hypothetical protein
MRPLAMLLALLALLAVLGACTSPEATRQRAGGAGGDVGNRRETVELHGGSQPYWRTPDALRSPQTAPVAAASPVSR